MTRHELQNTTAAALLHGTGHHLEVTFSESKLRGPFMGLCGTIEALDAALAVVEMAGNAKFTDRSIDPDDDDQVDFYSIA